MEMNFHREALLHFPQQREGFTTRLYDRAPEGDELCPFFRMQLFLILASLKGKIFSKAPKDILKMKLIITC